MAGTILPIGSTNPKTGAIQFDARRIDGVEFQIPSGATITSVPVGSVVSLQEDENGKQFIVLGVDAYSGDDEYGTMKIIAVGFLEGSAQSDSQVNQAVGYCEDGDIVAMISDINAVASVPTDTDNVPATGGTSYINEDGQLSSDASGNTAFPGTVWYGTSGQQNTGQLKTGHCFARLSAVKI